MCHAALAAEVRFFPADITDESRKSVPQGLKRVCENSEKKPQVPPLRFAPVGMTIVLRSGKLGRRRPHIYWHVIRVRTSLSGLGKFFQAEKEDCPSHGAVGKLLCILSPVGVAEMENGAVQVAKYLELDVGIEPVGGSASGYVPTHKFSRFEHRDLGYGSAEVIEPELEALADR